MVLSKTERMNGACVLRRFKGRRCSRITCVGYSKGSRVTGVFTRSCSVGQILVIVKTVDGRPVVPNGALVVLSRVRRLRGKLSSLGCFYRGTPRCRITMTNSLLNITVRRKRSTPIKGISVVQLCPVSFRRFLVTGSRRRLLGVLGDGS